METKHHSDDDSNDDEPNAKRFKMESERSPSSKPESKEPFLTLSTELIAKIIVHVPVDEWTTLELLDIHFRASTYIAWRQLRMINLEREFFDNKPKNNEGERSSSFGETVASVNSILYKLTERSPFLTSIRGFSLQSVNANMNSDSVRSLVRFEHLQSITVGDATFYTYRERGTPLENVVEFLESTQSRASLKELRLIAVDQLRANRATILDQFASSFVNGREIRSPLKLEKFSFTSSDYFLRIRLDTLDTTRLTDVRLGKAYVEPSQLTNLIERASNLSRIDLSLIYCTNDDDIECDGPRLQANKKLFTAMASHENWTTINFVSPHNYHMDCNCTKCGPELIEMLETIGSRDRLRKLGYEDMAINPSSIDMDELCATIHRYIHNLRSIKIFADALDITRGGFDDIFKMTELEEIDLQYMPYTPLSENAIKQIARMPHLERLGLHWGKHDYSSLMCLTNALTLTDLRISHDSLLFRASILDEWTEEFVSNLETLMLSCGEGNYDHDEDALVRFLDKAVRLRALVLDARITDRSLSAIAHSCPTLETLSVRSQSDEISVEYLQEIVTRCPNLTRLGGFGLEIRNQLLIPKSRRINDVNANIWDFDDDE